MPKLTEADKRRRERDRIRARKAAARERGRKLVAAARARAAKLVAAARARAKGLLAAASKPQPKRKVRTVKPESQPVRQGLTKLDQVVCRNQVRESMRRVAKQEKPGALLSVKDVRAVASLPKADFDRAALELMQSGEVSLHEHDFPASVSPVVRASMIQDERGRSFVGMAFRQDRPNRAAT